MRVKNNKLENARKWIQCTCTIVTFFFFFLQTDILFDVYVYIVIQNGLQYNAHDSSY